MSCQFRLARVREIDRRQPIQEVGQVLTIAKIVTLTALLLIAEGAKGQTEADQLELAARARAMGLQGVEMFGPGFYGTQGSKEVFLAWRTAVPDRDVLYQSMVRSLSKKFACFLTGRQRRGDAYWFHCRTGKVVHMKVTWGDAVVGYVARVAVPRPDHPPALLSH